MLMQIFVPIIVKREDFELQLLNSHSACLALNQYKKLQFVIDKNLCFKLSVWKLGISVIRIGCNLCLKRQTTWQN